MMHVECGQTLQGLSTDRRIGREFAERRLEIIGPLQRSKVEVVSRRSRMHEDQDKTGQEAAVLCLVGSL